jgi:hypothetical protein
MSYDVLRRGRHSAPNQTYHVTIVTAGRLRHFADFDIARAAIAEMRRLSDHRIVDSPFPGSSGDKARYGSVAITTMPCAETRICSPLQGISLPIRFELV